jgi:hypothetical protein
MFFVGSDSNAMVIAEKGDAAYDFAHALQADPTIFVQSHNQSATEWVSLAHNGTNAVLGVGTGMLSIAHSSGGKGFSTNIGSGANQTQVLTCDGGGSATLTTASLIPDGAWLVGVSTRITSAGLTGPATMSVGDGVDVDLFGSAVSVADNEVTDNSDATANWANPQLAAGEVTLTFNGGNCTAGTVRVTAHLMTITAPTAD